MSRCNLKSEFQSAFLFHTASATTALDPWRISIETPSCGIDELCARSIPVCSIGFPLAYVLKATLFLLEACFWYSKHYSKAQKALII